MSYSCRDHCFLGGRGWHFNLINRSQVNRDVSFTTWMQVSCRDTVLCSGQCSCLELLLQESIQVLHGHRIVEGLIEWLRNLRRLSVLLLLWSSERALRCSVAHRLIKVSGRGHVAASAFTGRDVLAGGVGNLLLFLFGHLLLFASWCRDRGRGNSREILSLRSRTSLWYSDLSFRIDGAIGSRSVQLDVSWVLAYHIETRAVTRPSMAATLMTCRLQEVSRFVHLS